MANWLSPADLSARLDRAPSVEIEFDSDKQLERYRQLLYSVNTQGSYTYRTRRFDRMVRGRRVPCLAILRIK